MAAVKDAHAIYRLMPNGHLEPLTMRDTKPLAEAEAARFEAVYGWVCRVLPVDTNPNPRAPFDDMWPDGGELDMRREQELSWQLRDKAGW